MGLKFSAVCGMKRCDFWRNGGMAQKGLGGMAEWSKNSRRNGEMVTPGNPPHDPAEALPFRFWVIGRSYQHFLSECRKRSVRKVILFLIWKQKTRVSVFRRPMVRLKSFKSDLGSPEHLPLRFYQTFSPVARTDPTEREEIPMLYDFVESPKLLRAARSHQKQVLGFR